MKKDSKPQNSLAKRMINRVAGRLSGSADSHPRRLNTENLEPRVLFSGSPMVPLEAPPEDLPTEPAQEAAPAPSQVIEAGSPDFASQVRAQFLPLTQEEMRAINILSGIQDGPEVPSTTEEIGGVTIEIAGIGSSAPLTTGLITSGAPELMESEFGWLTHVPVEELAVSFEDLTQFSELHLQGSPPAELSLDTTNSTDYGLAGLQGEIFFDSFLLDSLAENSAIEFDTDGFISAAMLGAIGVAGRTSEQSQKRRQHVGGQSSSSRFVEHDVPVESQWVPLQDGVLTLTIPSDAQNGDAYCISMVSAVQQRDFPAPLISVSPRGEIENSAIAEDHPECAKPVPRTETIEIGRYSNKKSARPSDRLFVDTPAGFDFTLLPSGRFHDLISSGNPLVHSKGEVSQSLEGSLAIPTFWGESFTAEVWLKPDEVTGTQHVLTIADEDEAPRALTIKVEDSTILLTHRTADFRFKEYLIEIPDIVTRGTWHHLAVSRETSEISVYVDGKNHTPGKKVSGLSTFGSEMVFSDNLDSEQDLPFDGVLCEFALYDRALDNQTILSHYNTGFASGPFGRTADGPAVEKISKPVFVNGEGWVSKSATELVSDGEPTENEQVEIIQELLQRLAKSAAAFTIEGCDLGVFISSNSRGDRAELAELDWASAEEILDHAGALNSLAQPADDHTRSLFITKGRAGAGARGFVADLDHSGKIVSVHKLELGDRDSLDVISALKASLSHSSRWASRFATSTDPDHLHRVSSVQSDVFGIEP